MRVLLIHPIASPKNPRPGRPAYFPFGIGSIAAVLRETGVSVEVFDNNVDCLDKHEMYKKIRDADFDWYGISATLYQYRYVKQLSHIIKELKHRPIVLGGPLATYSADVVLRYTDVDICVRGEGEETTIDLLHNLRSPEKVAGITFKDAGDIIHTPPRVFQKSRDEYPLPAYDLFDMEPYLRKGFHTTAEELPSHSFKDKRVVAAITGMGCPYRCRFCTNAVIKVRLRSVDSVIEEMTYLKDRYGLDGVRFIDDLLIMGKKRTLEFCRKVSALGLRFSGQARANTIDDDTAYALKEAGCVAYGIGVESGSQRMLNLMRKSTTVELNRRAILLGRKYGMVVKIQLLYGFPGENRESVEETVRFFDEIRYPPRAFNVLVPTPGSAVYDDCVELGIIDDEDRYFDIVSKLESGNRAKGILINLTEMDDEEFVRNLAWAENTMQANWRRHFRSDPMSYYRWLLERQMATWSGRAKKALQPQAWKRKIRALRERLEGDGNSAWREIEVSKRILNQYFNLNYVGDGEFGEDDDCLPIGWDKTVLPEQKRALVDRYEAGSKVVETSVAAE